MFIAVLIFYSLWILCTCIKQLKKNWPARLKRNYLFHHIPTWNFFSPNPGVTDMNLLRRFRLKNGQLSGFEEVPLRSGGFRGLHLFWNPNRRLNKSLIDHTRMLSMTIDENGITQENAGQIKLSFSYISLLNYCAKLPTSLDAEAIQLMLIESYGYISSKEPALLLNSEFHKI